MRQAMPAGSFRVLFLCRGSCLVDLGGTRVLVNATAESVSALSEVSAIDAVLVTNVAGLAAVVELFAAEGFCGACYATDPVLSFGRLFLLERAAECALQRRFLPGGLVGPAKSLPRLEAVLSRCVPVRYGERVPFSDGVFFWAHPSGSEVGGCFWRLAFGAQVAVLDEASLGDGRGSEPQSFLEEPRAGLFAGVSHVILLQPPQPPLACAVDRVESFLRQQLALHQKRDACERTFVLLSCSAAGRFFAEVLHRVGSRFSPEQVRAICLSERAAESVATINTHSEWLHQAHQDRAVLHARPPIAAVPESFSGFDQDSVCSLARGGQPIAVVLAGAATAFLVHRFLAQSFPQSKVAVFAVGSEGSEGSEGTPIVGAEALDSRLFLSRDQVASLVPRDAHILFAAVGGERAPDSQAEALGRWIEVPVATQFHGALISRSLLHHGKTGGLHVVQCRPSEVRGQIVLDPAPLISRLRHRTVHPSGLADPQFFSSDRIAMRLGRGAAASGSDGCCLFTAEDGRVRVESSARGRLLTLEADSAEDMRRAQDTLAAP